MSSTVWILISILLATVGAVVGFFVRKSIAEAKINGATNEAKRILDEANREAEALKKEALLEAKDEIHTLRTEAELEIRDRRSGITKTRKSFNAKKKRTLIVKTKRSINASNS